MTAASDSTLLFRWEPPRPRWKTLLGFIALSFAAHALCFYLFRISYPPAGGLLPPPARVQIISDATEEGRALLRWIEAEDPALASTTQRPAGQKTVALPSLEHVPSYLSREPELKKLPPLEVDLTPPSARPPAPVRSLRSPAPKSPPVTPTSIVFGPELEALGEVSTPDKRFAASLAGSPANAQFRIAVSADGVVRHVFLSRSSGDSALDEQARQYLIRSRFAGKPNRADSSDLTWSIAMLDWGNDLTPPKSETATPAP